MASRERFSIGNVEFHENKVVIIAEAGVNHLGDFENAEKLIRAAKAAGAEIIKFQTYKADRLTTTRAERFWKWEGEVVADGNQFDSYSRLDAFGFEEHKQLKRLCDEVGIEFMSTPFHPEAVDELKEIGVGGFKVASCDITNHPLLEKIALTGLPVLLSTGAAEISEIESALDQLKKNGSGPVLIMHCTLTYPTPPEDANMRSVAVLAEIFPNNLIGYSDHTLGQDIAASSVLFGAAAIEKHFTFDKSLPLSADHWLSADQNDLSDLVSKAQVFLQARGTWEKVVQDSELLARRNARRSCVAARDIKVGEILEARDVDFKRPGTGLSPAKLPEIIGKTVKQPIGRDEEISFTHLS